MSILRKINAFASDRIGRQIRKAILNPIERHRLARKDFTILSQNCVGSIWYHDLGLKFTSPTINMKFNGNSWVEFLEDYESFVDAPISFIESDHPYPVGYIGEKILVEFVHYKSQAEVISKWNERKKRVFPTKVVLGFDEGMNNDSIIRFLNLNQYPNRLLFIVRNRAEELNIVSHPKVIPVSCEGGAKLLNFSNLIGERHYSHYIDYVRFLNSLI